MLARVKAKGATLANLSTQLSPKESNLGSWHRHVLSSIALTAAQDVHHIAAALANPDELAMNLSYLAWAVRSLSEARIWTRLAIEPEHAGRFMGGLISDGLDIYAGFDTIVQKNLSSVGLAAQFGQLKTQLDNTLKQLSKNKSDLKFNIRAESENLGLAEEYQSMYKFLSKLAHVTATATIFSYQPALVEPTATAILLCADEYLDDMIERLNTLVVRPEELAP